MLCTEPEQAGEPPWCYVHGQPMPCPLNTGSAATDPVHVFAEPDQIESIDQARARTRGSRTIVVHQGPPAEGHITATGCACWCDTLTIPAG